MTVTCNVRIRGRVQGVGFRMHFERQALTHAVAGWVRNRHDGSVEAVLQGPREAVDAVIAWARRGPPNAQVTGVEVSPDSGTYSGFAMRPTE